MEQPTGTAGSSTVAGTASWGRRALALVIDWAASSLVTLTFVRYGSDTYGWVVLGIFALESALGTALAAGSFGQLLTGIRVLRVDRSRLPLIPAIARQILVCLVVPPLVFKPDGRGLHDLAAQSAAFELKALREG